MSTADKEISMIPSSSVWSILDMPDEILVEIILYLNARERLVLSGSCKRFDNLIFKEKKSLRSLDFSSEGYLTSLSDLKRYFNHKNKYEHIRRINLSNIYHTKPHEILQRIGKAKNLVEINVIGFNFQLLNQLASFLKPFEQLRKLSFMWPIDTIESSVSSRCLEAPFKSLSHIKIFLRHVTHESLLICALELCQALEELYLIQIEGKIIHSRQNSSSRDTKKLSKLKIAACCGNEKESLRRIIENLIPDFDQWVIFQPCNTVGIDYFYSEKNLDIPRELHANVLVDSISSPMALQNARWSLPFGPLLKQVIQNTDQSAPEKLCCLNHSSNLPSCLLTIKDTKLLLKNLKHQISYLRINHSIEQECDAHLLVLAFPNLTRLVLSNMVRSKTSMARATHLNTGLKKKRVALEGYNQATKPNSSFKKLVENTPQLEDLTLCASTLCGDNTWDLFGLHSIAGWRNLTALYLVHVPIRSGQFLVEIGEQCKNLDKLRLENLGPCGACCYKNELLLMLARARNLKDFSMHQDNFGQLSRMFNTLAENNAKLRRVYVKSLGCGNTDEDLVRPIEKMARSCNLILLACDIKPITKTACNELKSILQRLKDESNRPQFQFEIIRRNLVDEPRINFDLHFVHKDLIYPHELLDALYQLDCQ